MAAKLNLRRGTSFTNPSISEPFFNTNSNTLEVGYGTTTGEHVTLTKLGINTGSISFTGDVTASNAYFTGNTTVDGNIYLGGDIFLGDGSQATDNINVNATFSGSIVPVTADVFDLGAEGKYWNTIFALTGSFGNGIISGSSQLTDDLDLRYLEIGGDNVFSSSIQVDLTQTTNYSSGIKTRLDAETVISGSSQVNVNDTQNFTTFSSSVDSRFDYLEGDFSTSVDDRLDQLEIYTGSVDSLYEEIASSTHTLVSGSTQITNGSGLLSSSNENFTTFSSSVDSRLDTIEGPLSTSLDSRLDSLESFSSSLDDTFVTETELHTATSSLSASLTITDVDFEDRINTLETTFSSSVDSRLDTIEGPFSQSVDSRLDVIEGSFSQSVDLRLDELESTGSEHESRLDNIELYTSSLDSVYEEKASTTHALFSGSSQVNADTITNFDSNVKTKLDLDNVVSSSVQVTISDTTGYTTFSSSIATTDEGQNDRLDSIELYTASVDSLYEEIASGTHTLVSGSSQIQINSVSGFTAHSSSVDSRLDSLEGDSHTHSNKAQLDVINQDLSNTSNVTFNDITASGNVIVSGDLTVLGTATEIQTSELVIKDKLITIASGSTNSAEADGSGIEIDGAGKSIIWDDATQSFILNAKVSSSVGFKGDGSELENVTASDVEYANVLNKPDLVSGSSQISFDGITDKPTLVSGSSQIDHNLTTNFVGNEHVDHSTVSISAGNGISGGGDITTTRTLTLDTGSVHFKGGVKEKLNEESVVSGSSQILGGTGILSSSNENFTQFSSSIDTRVVTLETTFSSSVDSRLDYIEGTFSSSVDSRLDLQESFSASLDGLYLNTNGDNVISGSDQVTASLDLRYEEISSGTNTLVSGSSQVDVTQTTNIATLATTGSNVFIGNQTITGSLTTSGSVSFEQIPWPLSGNETHFFKTEPFTVQLESGSRSYDYAGFGLEHYDTLGDIFHNSLLMYMYDNHENPTYGTEINLAPVRSHFKIDASGSNEQAGITIMDNQDGTTLNRLYGTEINIGSTLTDFVSIGSSTTINTIHGLNTLVYSPITSSNTIEASFFIGDGSQLENVVASEITYEDITNLPSGLVSGSSQIDVTQTTNYSSIRQYDDTDNTTHLNSLSVVSGSTYSSPSQGTLRATINGANSDVDLGLQSTDTPTFNSLTASNLPNHDNTHFDALFKGTSGEFGYRTLATAAFYHVSNSIDDGNPLVLGNAGAVKTYVDQKIIDASAGDITSVNAGDGLSGGATAGDATLTLDTGSQHFIDGVKTKLNTDGVISGSDQVTASLDTRYVNASGDTVSGNLVISGDLTVNGTTTTINTTNLNVEDNIIELNYGGSTTDGGLLVRDVTGASLVSGSLIWDGTADVWKAGTDGSESEILTVSTFLSTLPEGTVSGSSQVDVTQTENYGLINQYSDAKVKLKLDADSVISGSDQILGATGILSSSNETFVDFSSSVDSRFGALSTDYNDLQNVPSGIVSSSTQISGYNVFLEIGGDSVVSGSSQIDVTQTTNYSSINQYSDAKVKLKLDADIVHSGSYLGTATTSNLTEGTGLYYTDGRVKLKLDADGVLSGSILDSYTTLTKFNSYTSSNDILNTTQDGRLSSLESFTASLDANYVTEAELASATGSLISSIATKLDTGSYIIDSSSFDSRLDSLEGVTSENPLTFDDTATVDLIRTGDVITANVIGGVVSGSSQVIDILDSLNTYTSSNDIAQTTQNGRLTALEVETGSISTEQSIQDGRLTNLESYTASVDSLYEEKASSTHILFSGSSQVNADTITNFDSNVLTYNNSLGVISGSSQVNADTITNFDSNVKTKLDAETVISGSTQVNADTITNFDSNVKDKMNVDGVISGSDQLTGSLVDLTSAQTISGTKTFTDIVVNGTGSFAYFVSTESELNIIGQSFIVLNNDTPTERYAGLAVYDSGSADTTASFQFDGQTNDWFYEYSDDGGVTTDHGAALFGPAYSTKGSPTYPTNNTIQKGNGGHHLLDSNITDDGSTITLGSNTYINGALSVSGSLLQTAAGNLGITSAGSISLLTSGGGDGVIINANGDTTIYGKLALQDIPTAGTATQAFVVGASNVVSQRTLGTNAFTSDTYLTEEVDTLQSVTTRGSSTSTTISITNATPSTSITTGALVVTGGIGTSGDVFAGGDVVAYASSDERLKDNILPIENPLQKINSIGGYSFEWNVEKQHIYKGKDYGVIAQEIESVLPELVTERENGYKAVKYDKLVSLLIEGIKELSQEVNELKKQINK